jgi:serine/threonine-protein kinase HipA
MLTNYDYLIGIEDFTRMGGKRYKEEDGDGYINASDKYLVPPIESLRALCEACHEIELAEERNELPEQRWLARRLVSRPLLPQAAPAVSIQHKISAESFALSAFFFIFASEYVTKTRVY